MLTQDFPKDFAGLTDPYEIFSHWWKLAHESSLNDANAFTLATVDSSGQPHARVVLAKEIRPPEGVIFYTNYNSSKGQDIAHNPKVAATFFWDPIYKQVRVVGEVTQLGRQESEKYWDSRPRSRQISQTVSAQSQVAESRAKMESQFRAIEEQFQNKPIPCPKHWGGFLIKIKSIEFWAGSKERFHDRIVFTKVGNSWTTKRLYP